MAFRERYVLYVENFVPVCLKWVQFFQCCVFLGLCTVGLCAYRGLGAPNACSGRLSAETAASIGRKGQFFPFVKENYLDWRIT